ncbi:MAG: phosphoglucomutase/phosphomannomutase family protein [Candidatus Omnitrophota bacterium]|nr:MAG: phosphoglucomutase/phosphomannomutase family protein [Candidatus Omnitrophota bacterium]
MSKEIKFGTDGWRGIIGQDFNLENVQVVAHAIADYLKRDAKKKSVAVGYDTRRLSKETAELISRILAANGIKTILSSGPLPTQAISYTVRNLNCAAGIMVTASHNPASFNGIKIKGAFGGPVEKDVTDKIERLIFKNRPLKISLSQARKRNLLKVKNLIPAYLKFVKSYLDMPLLKKGRLKVLVDSMYGTADSYIAAVLKGSKFRITTIHKRPDPSFGGIKPEPIFSCLKEASLLMREGSFDVGLATDGDADRLAALDNEGRFVNPQQILSLLLLHLIRYRKLKGAVVKNIAGTSLIERIAAKYKLKVYETPVGFKHISALMQRKNILIGGEEAGGIGFKDYLPERDGILGGLLLLEMMLSQKKSLKSLLEDTEDEFGSYFYLRKDIKCSLSGKNKIKTKLDKLRKKKTFLNKKITMIKDYDGLKFHLEDGSWILFRLSGTEPLLRIYAESSALAQTKRLIAQGGKAVSE